MSGGRQPLRRGRRGSGADSKGMILAAARRLFSERGFDGTSLRQVAREARVDPAMVHHYFSGKDQLFVSSVELPEEAETVLAGVEDLDAAERGEEIVRAMLSLWESPAQRGLVAFVRGTIGSKAKTALLSEILDRTILSRILAGVPGTPEEARIRGDLIATQMAGLLLMRYVVRLEPLASAAPQDLVRMVSPNIQRYLTGTLVAPR